MEEAHREARKLVAREGLTPELTQFVADRWREQFGLIEVG
jgi:hypothetical protein